MGGTAGWLEVLLFLLGSALIGSAAWTTVTLSPSPVEGTRIAFMYSDSRDLTARLWTWDSWPQVIEKDAPGVPVTGGTLRLHGLNFDSGMTVTLYSGPDNDETELTFYLIDSETADLTIPRLPAGHVGTAGITVHASTQPVSEVGAEGVILSICE